MRWTRRTVTTGSVRLAVRDSGTDKPPAVLIHGLATPQRSWDRLAPLLASGYRVVTFDLRGHGRSSAAESCAFADDVRAVMDALHVERPLLVGHSLGALLALQAATERECRAVVAVDGGLRLERPRELAGHIRAFADALG
ncbi:alpha/beta fold hydrolase [Thermoactinospora rubra]|uniref:alpha/beta fold hydrolase n=1 Tax=Thermoactinospora rubra TaxID=1088767 RepID=UPI000A112633|nr:alpha/beta fold hydrolase [Thermoactinospora rubra]